MKESTKKLIIGLIVLVVFVVCVGLVIVGQRNIGAPGLLTQLAGVAGLVLLLWLYNRQYK